MKRNVWDKSGIFAIFILLSICAFKCQFVCSEESVVQSKQTVNPVVLSNKWVRVEINAASGGSIHQYEAKEGAFFRPIDKIDSISQLNAGNALVLFKKHPLKGLNTIPLPDRYRYDLTQIATESILKVESEKSTAVSVKKEYRVCDLESVLHSTTTITNTGDSTLAFYPSEVTKYDAAVGQNRRPNIQAFLYSPYDSAKKGKNAFELIQGVNDKKQFSTLPEKQIFITRYMVKNGEVKLTNKKNWIVYQNLIGDNTIIGGTVCAVEYNFPDKKPESVEDNLIVYVSGSEPFEPGKIGSNQLDPFIRSTYVLGKVELKPGQSFTYTARWTATNCDGPIVDVRDGLVFNKHLEVEVEPGLGQFVNRANIGIPREGKIGFQYYDRKGNVRTIEMPSGEMIEHMLVMSIAYDLRPKEVEPFLPTYINHSLQIFALDDFRSPEDTYMKLVEDKAHSIRMLLVDPINNKTRLLDEVEGPFKIFEKQIR